MKNMLYISNMFECYKNKIIGQLGAFRKLGFSTRLCFYNKIKETYSFVEIYERDMIDILYEEKGQWSIFHFKQFVGNITDEYTFDLLYFRRLGISVIFWGKIISNINKKESRMIYEIPTYPFEKNKSVIKNIVGKMEILYLKYRIAPYSDCMPACVRIKGYNLPQKMLAVHNCVDASKYLKFVNIPLPMFMKQEIKFIAIAYPQIWHGYDRWIKAVSEWKGKINITFTIYGNYTKHTYELIQLCNELGEKRVEFIEEKKVKDFESFISKFHIAVGTLGIDRSIPRSCIGLDTSIKNKEYCAMGIPFIHASEDSSFGKEQNFHLLMDNKIEIDEIIQWYQNLRNELKDRSLMWEYAQKKLDFTYTIKKILEYKD